MASTIEDIDLGYAGFIEELKWLDGQEVVAGYFLDSPAHRPYTQKGKKVPMAQLATYLEYGTKHMPERPFMRHTFEKQSRKWHLLAKIMMANAVNNPKAVNSIVAGGLQDLGKQMREDIRSTISKNDFAARSEATEATYKAIGINPKGGPLHTTGQLKNSTKFKIRRQTQ